MPAKKPETPSTFPLTYEPWKLKNPRLVLRYDADWERHHRSLWGKTAPEGMLLHRCQLTDRVFALPIGCPVVVVEVDPFEPDGTPAAIDGPYDFTIHPEIVAAGPEALATELRRAVEGLYEDATEKAALARGFEDVLTSIEGAALPVAWPAYWSKPQEKVTPHAHYRTVEGRGLHLVEDAGYAA